MSKTTDGLNLDSTHDGANAEGEGHDRLTRLIQVILAFYLLPALAMVLLVGFVMIAAGAMARMISKLATLVVSPWGPHREEPSVSGAWVYRVGRGSMAKRVQRDPQPATQAGWTPQPGTDVLN